METALSCRFSRQSLEVGDHVKLLRGVTERYVRHECARDRVRWICDPGAQIILRPGQPGLLQGVGIRKSRCGCGGSPDSASEARTEGTRALVPGPAVSGKNAMLTGDALFVASGAVGCSDRFRVNRRCHKLPVSTSRTIPLHCQ